MVPKQSIEECEDLRTALPFATAHALCASRDGLRKSGFLTAMPVKTEIFLRGL